jgi:hypothetical protein
VRHPAGIIEGILGDPQQWQVQVWDPDRQNTTSYKIDADGTVHPTSTSGGAHELVPIMDLATDALPNVIDSPEALRRADQAEGAVFTQQTGVKLWSMQLTGRSSRLVWIVQYGQPLITQQQRLTIVLDATSGTVLGQDRTSS